MDKKPSKIDRNQWFKLVPIALIIIVSAALCYYLCVIAPGRHNITLQIRHEQLADCYDNAEFTRAEALTRACAGLRLSAGCRLPGYLSDQPNTDYFAARELCLKLFPE